jgi:plasmid stabilization system protein ParE
MRRARFVAEAQVELILSARFYEKRRHGLGDDFLDEIQELLARLGEYPESAPEISGGVRRARVRRFPFDLVYRLRGELIEVIAVVHQRRRPDYWKGRI